ncbi:MAG: type II secretion system F family protein, partial [Betaproteobacteria bacterium]
GEQFKLVALEMQAGKSREQALRNMADRIGIDEVRSLVTLLLQSEKLGTSIGQSLRVHADEMRRRRLVRAEDNANKLPAKMAVPLVCFILPSLMTVIMTPVVIRIIREVLPAFIERG